MRNITPQEQISFLRISYDLETGIVVISAKLVI